MGTVADVTEEVPRLGWFVAGLVAVGIGGYGVYKFRKRDKKRCLSLTEDKLEQKLCPTFDEMGQRLFARLDRLEQKIIATGDKMEQRLIGTELQLMSMGNKLQMLDIKAERIMLRQDRLAYLFISDFTAELLD